MNIRKIGKNENLPFELLLLADPSRDYILEYVENGVIFVAEIEQQIIGVYVLLPTSPEIIELMNIAVREDYQGLGIGKQLVMDAVKVARSKGYITLEVGTGNSSIRQLILYQKCGFRMIGVDTDFFVKHYPKVIFENGIQCVDMIRLARKL